MSNSKIHKNRIDGYLRPSNFSFIKGYAKHHDISKSQAMDAAAAALKKCTPPEQIAQILAKANVK